MSTPGRVTRQRSKTPLPAVAAKQTVAYGSRGRAELRSQVRGQTDDFATAFAGGRKIANRDASELPPVSEIEDEEDGSAEPEPEPTPAPEQPAPVHRTTLDAAAAYDGGIAAPKQSQNHQPTRNDRSRPIARDSPSAIAVLLTGLLGCFLGVLLFAVPLPTYRLEAARHNIVSGVRQILHARPYDVPPADLADRWFAFQHDKIFSQQLPDHNLPGQQWAVNINFLSRLEKAEERIAALESEIHLTNHTLSEIQRILPVNIILRQIDGKYDIPDEFWEALQQRMVEDSDLAPQWRAWLLRNDEELKQLQQSHLQAVFDDAVDNRRIVTREIFSSAIQENNDWLANEYSQELKKMWRYNNDNLKALTQSAAQDIIDRSEIARFTKAQTGLLAKANALHNTYQALRGVNFFSGSAGARIDPSITSPTATTAQPSRLARLWTKVNPLSPRTKPPITALLKWDEASECWCGSPAQQGGPVNIGVLTHHEVYPERLVLEHIPADGTFDIAAAPRHVEVWTDTGSKRAAEQYKNIMTENEHASVLPNCGSKPKAGFVCIGTGEYDIHGPNHVQSFKMWARAQEFGLPAASRVVVRVNSNWGANHTCVYRVRLTGTKA